MLIEFKVTNYRSICEEQIVSLVPATNQKEFSENIIKKNKNLILNSLALYGANSSGKSNILKAFELLDKLLYLSPRSSSTTKLPYDPFLLKEGYNNQPTKLQIIFIQDGTRYRYGVEFNQEEIISEWLFRKRKGREVELFNRYRDIIDVSSGFEGSSKLIDTAIEATRNNALFLSFCDMLNVDEAKTIFRWFDIVIHVDGLDTSREAIQTFKLFEDEKYKIKIKEYLSLLKLGFEDLTLQKKKFEPSELPDGIDESTKQTIIQELTGKFNVQVNTIHSKYNEDGQKEKNNITWPMIERESEGTKKAFQFSGPVIYTLLNGGILIVDEIEAKTHPILTLNTINLFLSKQTNPRNAQIIFATHDTNLLSYSNLRRDQINFVEKNSWEGTEIYSLSDFKYFENGQKERPDSDKEKRYLEGRYGAIPMLGESFYKKISTWYGKER